MRTGGPGVSASPRRDCQNRVLANEMAIIVKLVDNTSSPVRNAELAEVKPARAASLRDGRQIQQVIDSLMPSAA